MNKNISVVMALVLVLGLMAACSAQTEPATGHRQPVAAPAAAAAADCATALENAYAVVDASGNPALRKADAEHPVSESVAKCEQQQWSAEIRACLAAARSLEDIYHDCYMKPLAGRALTMGRKFSVDDNDAIRAADPPFFTQDGDYLELSEGCGFLTQKQEPAFAVFIVCDGETRGPLSMPDEVQEAYAAAAANEQARHQIVMDLVAKTQVTYFGGDHRVCDAYGNCHIE